MKILSCQVQLINCSKMENISNLFLRTFVFLKNIKCHKHTRYWWFYNLHNYTKNTKNSSSKALSKKQHVIFTNPLKYIPRNAVICQDRTLHLQEHSKQIIFLSPCLMFDNSNVISKSGFVKSDTKIPNQY